MMKTHTSGTAPHLRSTVARGFGWLTITGMLAFALLGPTAGVVSAKAGGNGVGSQTGQGAGLQHDGDQGQGQGSDNGQGNGGSQSQGSDNGPAQSSDNGNSDHGPSPDKGGRNITACPISGDLSLVIAGAAGSEAIGAVSVTVTAGAGNSISFDVMGGSVFAAYVKGGDDYSTYEYAGGTKTASGLTAPLNGGGNIPDVSHSVFCALADAPATDNGNPTSTANGNPTSTDNGTTGGDTAASNPPSGNVGGATTTPALTPTPTLTPAPTPTPIPTAPVGGGVAGATGTPQVTPPSTNTLPGDQQTPTSGTWRLILIAMAGLLASLLVLTPADVRAGYRRR